MGSQNCCRCCMICLAVLFSAAIVVYAISLALQGTDQARVKPENGTRVTPTLRFVIAVTRHGNRGPLFTYPNDPFPPEDTAVWPYGVGELTLHGRIQMFIVGLKLRQLYDGFLNVNYYQKDFSAYSTVSDRTFMSGEEFLAGIYPPIGFQIWSPLILWQPVPLFPTYLDHSTMVAPSDVAICPRFQAAQNKAILEFQQTNRDNITFILESLKPYTGSINATISYSLLSIWESFFCADNEGLPLPPWGKMVYPEPLGSIMAKYFVSYTIASDTMIRLLQGLLFQEIISVMSSKVNGTLDPDRQMFYYSGHDYTILGLMGILGLSDSVTGVVKTGSTMLYELHEDPDTNDHYVKVLYINGSSTNRKPNLEPVELNITACGSPCLFDTFRSVTKKYYNITSFEEECQLN